MCTCELKLQGSSCCMLPWLSLFTSDVSHLLRDAHPVTQQLALLSCDEERGKQCCSASCSTCPSCQHKKLLLLDSCEIQLGNYHLQFLTSCLCLTSNYEHFLALFKCTFVFLQVLFHSEERSVNKVFHLQAVFPAMYA